MPIPEEKCGADFLRPMVGRGATCADLDGDGDLDLLLAAVGGSPRLLRNDQATGPCFVATTHTFCTLPAVTALPPVSFSSARGETYMTE